MWADAVRRQYILLVGDKLERLDYKELIHNQTELPDKRLVLPRSGQSGLGKAVCSGNSVGEVNIADAINAGTTDLAKLCQATGVGRGCRSGKPEVKAMPARVGKR